MVAILRELIKQEGIYVYICTIINIDLRRCKSLSSAMPNGRMEIQREHLYR